VKVIRIDVLMHGGVGGGTGLRRHSPRAAVSITVDWPPKLKAWRQSDADLKAIEERLNQPSPARSYQHLVAGQTEGL
jgi:hypothetical protein